MSDIVNECGNMKFVQVLKFEENLRKFSFRCNLLRFTGNHATATVIHFKELNIFIIDNLFEPNNFVLAYPSS